MIKLFDIQNHEVVPTEHCYMLADLKRVMKMHPENYMKIYAYLFYMSCPNPELNPFFDTIETEKEELICHQLGIDFSLEETEIIKAMELCKKLYETPTQRAYMGIKTMLDKLADYMGSTEIEHGRDGNITSLINAAAKFDQIRMSFKGAYRDLMEEQSNQVRGHQNLAYDQLK